MNTHLLKLKLKSSFGVLSFVKWLLFPAFKDDIFEKLTFYLLNYLLLAIKFVMITTDIIFNLIGSFAKWLLYFSLPI